MKNNCICFILLFFAFTQILFSQQIAEKDADLAVKTKNYSQAIKIYSELFEKDKSKLSYLNWVARLFAWQGNYNKSIETFDKVLQIQPSNTEAKIGKSYVLMWQKKYGKAKRILDSTEPEISLYLAKINYFRYQNEKHKALKLLAEAKEKFPENQELQQLELSVKDLKTVEAEIGCSQNTMPFDLTEKNCHAKITIKKGKNELTVKTQKGEQFQQKFSETGISFKREINANLTVFGGFSVLNKNSSYNLGLNYKFNKFNMNTDISLSPKSIFNQKLNLNSSVDYKLNKKIVVGIDYRWVKIQNKDVKIISPKILLNFDEKSNLSVKIYRGKEFNSTHNLNSAINYAYSFGYERKFSKSLRLNFNYTKINENLIYPLNIKNKLNAFSAKSNIDITKNLSIEAFYGLTFDNQLKTRHVYGFNLRLSR